MKRLLGFVLGVCLVPMVSAQGKDSLWEITTRMEMADMPPEMKGMKIPGVGSPQKQTVCLAEGKKYESEQQKDCTVIDQKQTGKITRITVQCKDGTMKLEREEVNKDHWRLKMEMTADGEKMSMFEEARRVGSCNNEKEGNMSRETQQLLGDVKGQADVNAAQIGKECQKAAAEWPSSPHSFSTYDQTIKARKEALANAKGNKDALRIVDSTQPDVPGCAKARLDYCAKSKSAFGEAGSRKGYVAAMKRGKPVVVGAALSYCGFDLTPVSARHCKTALADADYGFIASFCPAERKVLAKEHCAGRAYTAVEPKFRAICGGGSGDDGESSGSGTADPVQNAKDMGAEAVEQGVKKLKGLFGF